jgi:protein phosphatase 1L
MGENVRDQGGQYQSGTSSVRDYSYSEDKNSKFRSTMEDTYCAKDKLCNDINTGVFGVFDGHGGKQVASHISERIPEELKKEMIKNHSGDLS